jgi:orotate phosphoribosyltransferase
MRDVLARIDFIAPPICARLGVNFAGAFKVARARAKGVRGKRIVVVEDVITTGARRTPARGR